MVDDGIGDRFLAIDTNRAHFSHWLGYMSRRLLNAEARGPEDETILTCSSHVSLTSSRY